MIDNPSIHGQEAVGFEAALSIIHGRQFCLDRYGPIRRQDLTTIHPAMFFAKDNRIEDALRPNLPSFRGRCL